MPIQSVKRGALPSPRSVLAAAVPHTALIGAPPNFIMKPARISMWGNADHKDCVTAEEAFAKACHNPENLHFGRRRHRVGGGDTAFSKVPTSRTS